MDILLIKLVLTPLLVAALTLIGRRWGSAISGAVAGLPLTSGPVSLFLALERGKTFAIEAAAGTVIGLLAVAALCLAYSLGAQRTNWALSTFAGLVAFLVIALLGTFLPVPLLPAFVIVVSVLAITFRVMPHPKDTKSKVTLPPAKWDLPMRMGIATALVFLLTAIAPTLGPHTTGLISPLPVFGGVLAVFAHRHSGAGDAQRVLRALVLASIAFAVFFLIVGTTLPRWNCIATYSLATIAALFVNGLLFAKLRRNFLR